MNLDFTSRAPEQYGDVSQLESLSLNGCSEWVTDAVLQGFSIGGKLQSVSLFRCWRITDRSVYVVAKNCGRNLRSINLSGCSNISDKALSYLSRFCLHGIVSIDITRCPRITDLGVNYLCHSEMICKTLKSLRLYADSDLGISAYSAISALTNLEELDLCGHSNLDDDSLICILEKCPKLRVLNLSWCVSLRQATIGRIVARELLGCVESISLFGNKAMSNVNDLVEYFARRCSKVRELDVRGIPAIENLAKEDCRGLRQRLPQLVNWRLHT